KRHGKVRIVLDGIIDTGDRDFSCVGFLHDGVIQCSINFKRYGDTTPATVRLRVKRPVHTHIMEERETVINAMPMRGHDHQGFRFCRGYAPSQFLHGQARCHGFFSIFVMKQGDNHTSVWCNTGKCQSAHSVLLTWLKIPATLDPPHEVYCTNHEE